jgi:hypothetical protein
MERRNKKYRTHFRFTIVMLVLLCTTCLDPFPLPDVSIGYLVVEGRFTDDPATNQVILSFAGRVNEDPIPVTGASVYVRDDLGGTGWFEESGDGLYLPRDQDYYGSAGRTYLLHIELADGRRYRSDSCLFLDVPPIDDFCWDLKQTASQDNTEWLNGIEFKIDTQDPENVVQNFLWTYDEIWEVPVPYAIRDVYMGNNEFQEVYNPSRCFFHNVSSEIMIKSTIDQSEAIIKGHPIVFVSSESPRLFRQYRIILRQFNLSDEAYFYHEQLQEISSRTGSVFDKQPFTLRGNVRNLEEPSEVVMGYFLVSGVSTRSINIRPVRDLPYEYWGKYPVFMDCINSTYTYPVSSSTNFYRLFTRWLPRTNYVLVSRVWEYPETDDEDPILTGLLFAYPQCTVCDGGAEIPENWDNW